MTKKVSQSADKENSYFFNHAIVMMENGYHPIPIQHNSKHPVNIENWQQYCWSQPNAVFIKKYNDCDANYGVGLACGRNVVAIDIDAKTESEVEIITAIALRVFGSTPLVRQGKKPRTALVYGAAEVILTCRLKCIDVLGLATQLVAYGIHPKTGKPYTWIGDGEPINVKAADLPHITNAQIEEFVEKVCESFNWPSSKTMQAGYDTVNFSPATSSVSVLLKQLATVLFKGKPAARKSAKHFLDSKYFDTGSGIAIRSETEKPNPD